jgi:hypothetical protein
VKILPISLVLTVMVTAACTDSAGTSAPPATTLPTERCGNEVQADFDPGLESRTVIAGPVAMVPFRVSPVAEGTSPARNFKLAVRLDARTDATVRTKTRGTTLMFDRERARADNVYRLQDGTKRVRFTGCPDRSALFVGAVLSTGPTRVKLDVTTNGRLTPVTITAFDQ